MLDLRLVASLLSTPRLSKLDDLPLSAESLAALEEASRCPRCGTELESVGTGGGCLCMPVYFVVPPILVLKCPQCGYEERSWVC